MPSNKPGSATAAGQTFGQRNIRGQVVFQPRSWQRESSSPNVWPMINVEGGCATASMAFQAGLEVSSLWRMEASLAIGVEKTFVQNAPRPDAGDFLKAVIDQMNPEVNGTLNSKKAAIEAGKRVLIRTPRWRKQYSWIPMRCRPAWHMKTYGRTQNQIAMAASKNTGTDSMNPQGAIPLLKSRGRKP